MKNNFSCQDIIASLVVFLVALPLCMGIALASGLPPAAGLISGIIAGLVLGSLAGCPLQVSGPAAGLIAVVWDSVQRFGIESLGLIVLLAGLMQLAIGFLGIASWFRAMSPAVIQGGLSGLGALIAASQFHAMLDAKPKSGGLDNLLSIPETLFKALVPMDGTAHHLAAILGIITLTIMVIWTFLPNRVKQIPPPLVAVVVAVILSQTLNFPVQYISIPDNILAALTPLSPTQLPQLAFPDIWAAAFSIAFVATIETVLTMIAIERMKPGQAADFNRELKAQGIGNSVCGFLGVLPVAGVIIRSAANINAGASTRVSAMLHGVWMLFPVIFFPFVLESIPVAALAALLVYTGIRLINLNSIKVLKTYGNSEVAIFLVTMTTTVLFNLLTGVLVGLGLTLVKLIYRFTRLNIRQTSIPEENSVALVLEGSATFVKLPKLADALSRIPVRHKVVLHLEQLAYIDHACLEFLMNWEKRHLETGGQLTLAQHGACLSIGELGRAKGDMTVTKT